MFLSNDVSQISDYIGGHSQKMFTLGENFLLCCKACMSITSICDSSTKVLAQKTFRISLYAVVL